MTTISPRAQVPGPLNRDYSDERKIREEFENIYKLFQPLNFRVMKTAPNTATISEGQIFFLDDGAGTLKLYTKLNGTLRTVALI